MGKYDPRYYDDEGRFDYRAYRRAYETDHPDRKLKWRLTAAINLLERHGYTVIARGGES